MYVGYRWYEQLELPVLFPFGHGLSYTSFSYSDLSVSKVDAELKISVKVTNTGVSAGSEVVQVYVSQKNPSIRRPIKELKGFAKVVLDTGESKAVEILIAVKYAASFWDEIREKWIAEKDDYEVIVGKSSQDKGALKAGFKVDKTSWWTGL